MNRQKFTTEKQLTTNDRLEEKKPRKRKPIRPTTSVSVSRRGWRFDDNNISSSALVARQFLGRGEERTTAGAGGRNGSGGGRVPQHVAREGGGRGEGAGAEVAAEGPLARVHAQVVLHVGLLDEALGAAGALVGAVARVDALVARQQ